MIRFACCWIAALYIPLDNPTTSLSLSSSHFSFYFYENNKDGGLFAMGEYNK